MILFFTSLGCRTLALAATLAAPGLVLAQQALPAPALSAFAAKAKAQGLSAADVASPLVTSSYVDSSTGLTHTYLQQQVNGLAIFNATGAVHTDRAGKVVFSTQDFVAGAAAKAPSATPGLSPEQAVTAAAVRLGLPRPVGLRTVTEARLADGIVFNNAGISEAAIPVRLVYARVGNGLVLVWNVTIAQLDQQHYWNARIDAQTGQLVDQNDYTVSEQATFNQVMLRLQHNQQHPLATASAAEALALASTPDPRSPTNTTAANSVTVVALPLESPAQGARTVVPLATAGAIFSPYGWQVAQPPSGTFADTYSFVPSGRFVTRGNNVAAYDDYSNTADGAGAANYALATSAPDGGTMLNFDFPFDQAAGGRANLDAATTNLFYVNNVMHDVMLAHGFDEPSGNFQYKNATGTGRDLDQVRAESQDGSGRNNANFSTPVDGSTGTMQMYLWDNSATNTLTLTAPSSLAGTYSFATASFGPVLSTLPNGLCGNIVPVNDGVSADGGVHSCAAPTNAAALAGNIALIMRGGCTAPASNNFSDKVKFAQLAGAIGAIVYDSNPTTTAPLSLGGTDATVTIPAIGISGVLGARFRAALTGTTVGVGCAKAGADWDGSFDNGIVSHEYGHGISNRLTGGPANSSCLISNAGTTATPIPTQQMGEGWSDFIALWMTTKPGDVGSTNRYVGTYVEGQNSTTGPGIRTKPYTTNFSANNLTYGTVLTVNSSGVYPYQEAHNLGEIWTATLWDLNWQFISRYGYHADTYGATGGNNQALRLVLDACKIQICNPGFLDGRDAILRADSLTNRGANSDVIWNVFARRGMGYSATYGDRINGTPRFSNIQEAFDLPPRVQVIVLATQNSNLVGSALEAYPNPAQDLLTVRTLLSSTAPMQVTVVDLLGKTVVQSTTVPVAQMQQNGVALNTSRLATGIYVVRVTTTEGIYTTKVTIQH